MVGSLSAGSQVGYRAKRTKLGSLRTHLGVCLQVSGWVGLEEESTQNIPNRLILLDWTRVSPGRGFCGPTHTWGARESVSQAWNVASGGASLYFSPHPAYSPLLCLLLQFFLALFMLNASLRELNFGNVFF